jgi:hypothetical protein
MTYIPRPGGLRLYIRSAADKRRVSAISAKPRTYAKRVLIYFESVAFDSIAAAVGAIITTTPPSAESLERIGNTAEVLLLTQRASPFGL